MNRSTYRGLVALGAMACAGAATGEALARPAAPATKAVAQVARPGAVQQRTGAVQQRAGAVQQRAGVVAAPTKATKVRNRDRGSFNVPKPGSAYYALGLHKRFLKPGDTWTMAWSAQTRFSIRKAAMPGRGPRPFGPATYVNYRVKRVWRAPIGTGFRTLATIQITYARPPLASQSTGAEVTVDQFWNPVSYRVFTTATPYGKRQDKDTRRVLHGVAEFPLYVGDLENVAARAVPLPRILPQLAQHRPLAASNYAIAVNNGKNVHAFTYWAPGNLYATYVVSQHHQGILVSQQLAR